MRYGDMVLKRRYASMFVDSFTASFATDAWVKLTASLKGTGKVTNNIVTEFVTAMDNAASLALAANGVQGSSAALRLDNVQSIKALFGGVWVDVAYTAVSLASPAVIAIGSVGGVGASITYQVMYLPTAAAWETFPSRISETPLRVAQCTFNMGGAWTGTAFTGGHAMSSEVKSIDWTCNNGLAIDFVLGAGDTYAGRCFRPQRTQTLKVNREFRDYIFQARMNDNDTFGVYLLAQGALYEAGHHYQVELIWPKCAILTAPLSVDGKKLAEAGDLVVLQDDTYGSVIARVKNLQTAYAA